MGLFDSFTGTLVPPEPTDLAGVRRWHIIMAFEVWCVMIFAAWALGLGAYLGLPGLARADDVGQLQSSVQGIQLDLLESALLSARRAQCAAITANNDDARHFYGDKIAEKGRLYVQLTGRVWSIPSCDSI